MLVIQVSLLSVLVMQMDEQAPTGAEHLTAAFNFLIDVMILLIVKCQSPLPV